MTNVFVTDLNPRTSARNLDNKRLARMAFEAYEAVCAGLASVRHPNEPIPKNSDLPYLPRKAQRSHPVCKWVGEDRWHAWWTLIHADECAREHQRRYGSKDLCLAYQKCHEYLWHHIDEIPSIKYGPIEDFDFNKIDYYGAFTFDWFRKDTSAREGHPILHPDVHLVTRYRLSMLHKWLYLDARATTFGPDGPPEWAFKPSYRTWIDKTFGPALNNEASLARLFDPPMRIRLTIPEKTIRKSWDATTLAETLWAPKSGLTGEVNGILTHVVFNLNHTHRYVLAQQWDKYRPPLIILMTNPSTADHLKNDKTINRVVAFAKKLGYGGVIAMNVFSIRARDPEDVVKSEQPITADSYTILHTVLSEMYGVFKDDLMVVAAWGALAPELAKRLKAPSYIDNIVKTVERIGAKLHCFELSKDGHPKHPLYLSGGLKPKRYWHGVKCYSCMDSKIEEVYGGHGTVLEVPCSICQ